MHRLTDLISRSVHPLCHGASPDLFTIQAMPYLETKLFILSLFIFSKSAFHPLLGAMICDPASDLIWLGHQ